LKLHKKLIICSSFLSGSSQWTPTDSLLSLTTEHDARKAGVEVGSQANHPRRERFQGSKELQELTKKAYPDPSKMGKY